MKVCTLILGGNFRILSVFISAFLLLSGCAESTVSPKEISAVLVPGVSYKLPAPVSDKVFSLRQLLQAHYAGDSYDLVVILESDGTVLKLAGLTVHGLRLFSASYDGYSLNIDKLAADNLPDPNQMLSDVMLSLYPKDIFDLPAGFTLSDTNLTRTLKDPSGKAVLEISYRNLQGDLMPIRIKHLVFNYEINLTYLD